MIRAPQAPPEVLTALKDAQHEGMRENALRVGAHRVFTATAEDVLQRRVLGAAKNTSWREVTGPTAVEVALRDGAYILTSENTGPFAEATRDALERATQLDGDYELRLLNIPSLYLLALWLYGDSGSVLIPLSPTPTGLNPNEPYDEASFTEALRPLAERRSTLPMV